MGSVTTAMCTQVAEAHAQFEAETERTPMQQDEGDGAAGWLFEQRSEVTAESMEDIIDDENQSVICLWRMLERSKTLAG